MSKKRTGNVYWANSQRIDKTDSKNRRQYVVVKDNGKYVGVSKIRGFDDNIKNKDRLYELNQEKYGLSKKCGVDKKVYIKDANNKLLILEDTSIFDKLLSFSLSSHDTHRVLVHTGIIKKGRKS